MKKWMSEFKEFAFKGNVLDMSIGVIIGGAFGKIVTSLVNDIFMPVLGLLTGGVHFGSLKWVMSPAQIDEAGNVIKEESALLYGSFIQNIIDFLIIAICIFFMIKAIATISNKLRRQEEVKEEAEEEAAAPSNEEVLLTEIRDLLKEKMD